MKAFLRISFYVLLIGQLLACGTDVEQVNDISDDADTTLVELPIVYIQRQLNAVDERAFNQNIRRPAQFNPGAKLFIQANALPTSTRLDLTSHLFQAYSPDNLLLNARYDLTDIDLTPNIETTALYDVSDVTVSRDGTLLAFAMHSPVLEGMDEDDVSWNIWLYHRQTKMLSRLIQDPAIANAADDRMPEFLPNGGLVFSSNRQRASKAILLDEGKPQYNALEESLQSTTFNIHRINLDGTDLTQLTFNLSHETYPKMLANGQIVYSRWDNTAGNKGVHLYRMNPDGTDNEIFFGRHSHRLLDSEGERLADVDYRVKQTINSSNRSQNLIVDLVNDSEKLNHFYAYLAAEDFVEVNLDVNNNEIDAALGDTNSPLQAVITANYLTSNINLAGEIHDLHVFPDDSNRILVSLNLCRVVVESVVKTCTQYQQELTNAGIDTQVSELIANETLALAEPAFGLWLINIADGTQEPVVFGQDNTMLSEPLLIKASDEFPYIAKQQMGVHLDAQLVEQNMAVINIRSVYDFAGTDASTLGITQLADPLQSQSSDREARFLKVIRGVPIPPREVQEVAQTSFGVNRSQLMRDILGYVPIEPDGSVVVQVPANLPIAISVLDANGQRISDRHQQWLTAQAGETLSCNGCHTTNDNSPHGRVEAEVTSINIGLNTNGGYFVNTPPELIGEQGQTMAQVLANANGVPQLAADLIYQDFWTDSQLRPTDETTRLSYQDLTTMLPEGVSCFEQYSAYCRIRIHYPDHIQPLWHKERLILDTNTNEVIADQTCITCHNPIDSEGVSQVPAAQLSLTDAASDQQAAHMTGYRELFFNDSEQVLTEGILVNRLIEVVDNNGDVVYQIDEEGELILDAEGFPIPVLTTVTVRPVLRAAGAKSSQAFFDLFAADGSHAHYLNQAELRLISEWLDIGAQYHNSPFYQVSE